MRKTKPKLLCILGPTSSGKTDLAIILAKKLNGEIISADSRQVYKYLDIGTGKMPGSESRIMGQVFKGKGYWILDGVKIWMYDVCNPETRFNLYEYIVKTKEIIKRIANSGKLPILAGGTGLYIRSLLEGVSNFGINENQDLREELEKLEIVQIREKINETDPAILKTLNNSEINNKRRLIRILEKFSSRSDKKSFPSLEKEFNILKIGLTAQRQILNKRIDGRVVKRIEQGMIEESEDLLNKQRLTLKRMKELGLEYGVLADFIQGKIKTKEKLIDELQTKIHQFAKRQETWFKREKEVLWFDITEANFLKKVEKTSLDWYNDHT